MQKSVKPLMFFFNRESILFNLVYLTINSLYIVSKILGVSITQFIPLSAKHGAFILIFVHCRFKTNIYPELKTLFCVWQHFYSLTLYYLKLGQCDI